MVIFCFQETQRASRHDFYFGEHNVLHLSWLSVFSVSVSRTGLGGGKLEEGGILERLGVLECAFGDR